MRKIALMVVLAIVFACPAAFAGEPGKMALVDVQRVVMESATGKKLIAEMKEFSNKKKAEVQSKLEERDARGKDLQKQIQSGVLTEEAAQKKITEFQAYMADVEKFAHDMEEEVRNHNAAREDTIKKDLAEIIERMGKEGGYMLILRYENVVYNDESIPDITAKVIAEYDAAKSKAGEK